MSEVRDALCKLGGSMESGEMALFCFILEPLFNYNLPKNKQLDELYSDVIKPRFEEDALAHVWFGVNAIGISSPDCLLPLLQGRTLSITDQSVLLRKLLAKITLQLCSDVGRSKKFIRSIVSTGELEGVSSVRDYMPPEERQNNHNAFIPYILKLFREAEDRSAIKEDNLSKLKRWLDENHLKRLSTEVSNFNAKKTFHHRFHSKDSAVPSRPPKVSSQCSEESEDGSKQASKSCPTFQNSIEESSDDSTAGDISPAEGED